MSNPVRWDLCMATMVDLGVTGLLELAPAGTLVGLAKRAMKGVETVALKTPDDLEAAQRSRARGDRRHHLSSRGLTVTSPTPHPRPQGHRHDRRHATRRGTPASWASAPTAPSAS